MSAPAPSFEQALEEFLRLRRGGARVSPAEFAAQRPELGAELLEALESAELLESLREPVESSSDDVPQRFGEFLLLERLGGGGMGVVYRARQESLGRDVALKLIRPEHLALPRAHERFRREALAAAHLQHPGLVPIHSVGEAHGAPFLALELVRGATLARALHELSDRRPESLSAADLAQALQRATPAALGWDEQLAQRSFTGDWVGAVVRLVLQVAHALDHAHSRGVLHRDVKPSNIAVSADGRAVLLDFGLAALASSEGDAQRLTASRAEVGSLPYMAPERLRGARAPADRRVDVYALGVTLYELLALRLPFAESESIQTRERILEGDATPLRSLNRRVSRDLALVCATAMDPDPQRRYADAAAFARDLSAALELRPIEARPAGPTLIARRWMQRHPWRALSLALLVVGPTALLWRERSHALELRSALDEARHQRAAAELEARDASQTSAFLTGLFESVDPALAGGGEVSARALLDEAARRLEAGHLKDQPAVRARLMHSIGESYAALGEWAPAQSLLEQSLALAESLEGGANLAVVRSLSALASLELQLGQGQPLERAARAVELHRGLALPLDLEYAELLVTFAAALSQSGELGPARVRLDEATRALEALPGDWRSARAGVLVNRAELELEQREYDVAIATALEGLELQRAWDPAPHPVITTALNTIALALRASGRFDEARSSYAELLEEEARLTGEDSARFAGFLVSAAGLDLDVARPAEAVARLERARAVFARTAPPSFPNALTCLEKLALALERIDRREEALEVLRARRAAVEEAFGASAWQALAARVKLAQALVGAGDQARAREELEGALRVAADASQSDDDAWEAAAAAELADLAVRGGDLAAARAALARARALRDDSELRSAAQNWIRLAAGAVAELAGELELAQRELEPLAERARGPAHAEAAPALARARLARLLATSAPERAQALRARAAEELGALLGPGHARASALLSGDRSEPR